MVQRLQIGELMNDMACQSRLTSLKEVAVEVYLKIGKAARAPCSGAALRDIIAASWRRVSFASRVASRVVGRRMLSQGEFDTVTAGCSIAQPLPKEQLQSTAS